MQRTLHKMNLREKLVPDVYPTHQRQYRGRQPEPSSLHSAANDSVQDSVKVVY